MYLLEEINRRGTTIVMATHNKEIVNTFRQRVIAIEQGVIVRTKWEENMAMRIETLSRHIREAYRGIHRNAR